MNKRVLSVILVEDDLNECEIYKKLIKEREDVKLLSVTNSSVKALAEVKRHNPDAVILDLELNDGEGSGFEFISKIQEMELKKLPKIVVTTNVHSDSVYDYCHKNNIDFVFYKGQKNYSRDNVIDTLMLLNNYDDSKIIIEEMSDASMDEMLINKINKEMDLIGISTHLQGRKYIVDAILEIIKSTGDERVSIIQQLVNKYKKSSSTISRAMQNAIIHAWRVTPIEDLTKYYTARVNYETGMPTPTELLYFYAEKIKKEV